MDRRERWDIYDSHGRMRMTFNDWRLYCLFCLDGNSVAYVKVGISSQVYDRIRTLKTGLIFEMKTVLHTQIGGKELAGHIERRIHQAFRHRKTRGEWFRFDLTNAFDKQEFHGVVKSIIATHTGKSVDWQKITPEQLNAYVALKVSEKKKPKRAKYPLQCA